jgi:hypothetical protein
MRSVESHRRTGVRSNQALFSWALPTIIVLAAVFGPPLTGNSLPALTELRDNVLMIDREFDRWAVVLTNTSSSRTEASRDI